MSTLSLAFIERMKKILTLSILTFLVGASTAQVKIETEQDKEYYDLYNKRITKSHLNEVYIPVDVDDAFSQLLKLSEPAGIAKFKRAPEEVVAQKLKGGLGRWMLINWGFIEGSRLSHHIKSLGIGHPDDMAQFLLVSFHRHLNEKPLNIADQAKQFQLLRSLEYQSQVERDTFPKQ